ncbi:hypothetical protein [Thermus sp.]|uniref:hypothetical protein n=1 Tax=Thermus sp. TaxID=275 RepID=UPI00307DC26B
MQLKIRKGGERGVIGHGCPNASSTTKTPPPQPDTSAHDHPEAPEAGPAGQVVRALKEAGAWGEVYGLLRPYFPTPRLWVRYLETLAAIPADLGPDGFAYGVRFALAQLARGVVFSPPGPKPKPPLSLEDGQEVAFLTAAGELKHGLFAGWTGGYRLAFVDTGGLVYRVPVERLRVEGLTA